MAASVLRSRFITTGAFLCGAAVTAGTLGFPGWFGRLLFVGGVTLGLWPILPSRRRKSGHASVLVEPGCRQIITHDVVRDVLSSLDIAILEFLRAMGPGSCTLDIYERIDRSYGGISTGQFYPALWRLAYAGYIVGVAGPTASLAEASNLGGKARDHHPREYYSLSEFGERALDNNAAESTVAALHRRRRLLAAAMEVKP